MDKIIGFIGYGNMAQAIAKGLINSKTVNRENILASKRNIRTRESYDVQMVSDNKEVANKSDFIIIATKPNSYGLVIEEIRDYIREDAIVISIAAGISSDFLRKKLNKNTKFIKTMPNTPAMVGEAMTAISPNDKLSQVDVDRVIEIFSSFGKVEVIEETLMDGFTGIAGSSPAYIYMLIEAMADGGVAEGLARDQAYTMAAQAVLGSAKMVLESGKHPGQLKDKVCSPGGTTIDAVASLEESGFRSSIIKAIGICSEKSRKMNI